MRTISQHNSCTPSHCWETSIKEGCSPRSVSKTGWEWVKSITESLDASCYCSQLGSPLLAETTPLGSGGMLLVSLRVCSSPTSAPDNPALSRPGAARSQPRRTRSPSARPSLGPLAAVPGQDGPALPMPGRSTPAGESPQEASPPRRAAPHPGTRARAARAARGSASSSCRSFPASARFQGARRSRRCSAARPGWEHAPRRRSSAPTAGPAARALRGSGSWGCALRSGVRGGRGAPCCCRAQGDLRETGERASSLSRRADAARGEAPIRAFLNRIPVV